MLKNRVQSDPNIRISILPIFVVNIRMNIVKVLLEVQRQKISVWPNFIIVAFPLGEIKKGTRDNQQEIEP